MRLGIDLGGTKTEIIAITRTGDECYRKRVDTPSGDYPAILNTIASLIKGAESTLTNKADPSHHPLRVGVGIPGTLSPDTGRVKNANSVCLIGQHLEHDLEKKLQRPIRIANDADCFTLSEASDGAGQGYNSVFGVILGTGVGGGIYSHGHLLGGPNAISGEWGHNPLPWRDEQQDPALDCYCGKQGCIETYLSGPGLCRHYDLQRSVFAASKTVNLKTARAETVIAQFRAGEEQAIRAFAQYCDRLARALSSVINIVDPEIVVLGGGLSNIDELYEEIPRRWGRYVFSDQVNTCLAKAKHGDSSGVRGAAWLWPDSE